MALTKTKAKTVYICSNNADIVRAGSTLPKMVETGLFGKSYYFYYRKLRTCDSFLFIFEGITYKIQRVNYD